MKYRCDEQAIQGVLIWRTLLIQLQKSKSYNVTSHSVSIDVPVISCLLSSAKRAEKTSLSCVALPFLAARRALNARA